MSARRRMRRHLLLGTQLPGLFALCLAGAYLAFTSQQAFLGWWLCAVAAWVACLWLFMLLYPPHRIR